MEFLNEIEVYRPDMIMVCVSNWAPVGDRQVMSVVQRSEGNNDRSVSVGRH